MAILEEQCGASARDLRLRSDLALLGVLSREFTEAFWNWTARGMQVLGGPEVEAASVGTII